MTVAACVAAVWLAVLLADGALLMPIIIAAIAVAAILVCLIGQRLDAILLSFLMAGYIVGNRGFAQLMPIPALPLFPGEIGLGVCAVFLLFRCARDKTLPWRPDALNYALLVWFLIGTARLFFDFPRFGFVALRDYATVYYAAFFFIAQRLCAKPSVRDYLLRSLLIASLCLPVVFALFAVFPAFFLQVLTFRGVPLIYFKGDLAPMFLGVGGILLSFALPMRHRGWARVLATAMILWIFTGENRSSMIGILVALGWIACSRYCWFALTQAGIMLFALIVIAAAAGLGGNSWAERKMVSVTERAMSVVDFSGSATYRDESSSNKSENIQFRWIWWRSVVGETLAENPVLGQGFGYDLARGFLQNYTHDLGEDFSARSPHNIVVTAWGRMGLVGLAIIVWIIAGIARRTWRVVRDPESDPTKLAAWAAVWPILTSACLGVVLEGPMGAVVFWSLLGVAHSYDSEAPVADGSPVETSASADAADEVAFAPGAEG